jgi:glutathione S-transferase
MSRRRAPPSISLSSEGPTLDFSSEGPTLDFSSEGPTLEVDGAVIPQSRRHPRLPGPHIPGPAAAPSDPILRAQSLAFGQLVAGEIHALTIRRVRLELASLGVADEGVARWVSRWFAEGLDALEEMLARRARDWPYCFGETPGWADLHLVPQLEAARRLGVSLGAYPGVFVGGPHPGVFVGGPHPRLLAVESRCVALQAFRSARGDRQPAWVAPRREIVLADLDLEEIGRTLRSDHGELDDYLTCLDTREGELVMALRSALRDERLGEDEVADAILAEPDRYLEIPSRPGGGRLSAFLDSIEDPRLAEALQRAARGGKGAYRRVRDALAGLGELERWFAFEAAQDRQDALEWLEREGFVRVVDPTE